ncbi:MAG: fibronectin type III domain-containing protein, partial [Thermoplasmata archaeon]|nr:fibronectin type III domain-containing protein [Thermoplasmata archaeon]
SRAPYSPRNFSAVSRDGHITLSWDPPLDNGGMEVLGYSVYRWMEHGWEGTGWHRMMTLQNTSWTDTIVEDGVIYLYCVEAYSNRGLGDRSSEISINNTELKPPSTPQNILVFLAENGISISWDVPESEGDMPIVLYRINRQVEGSTDTFRIASTALTIYLDSNITSNTTYHYSIFAVSDAGVSNSSEMVTINVGDLSKIEDVDPINVGEERFPWAVLIVSIIILLVLIGALIGFLLKRDKGSEEPIEEGSSTGEITNVVIEGKESGFPDDEVERAPPIS